jgi:hypothetical protein
MGLGDITPQRGTWQGHQGFKNLSKGDYDTPNCVNLIGLDCMNMCCACVRWVPSGVY